jgi:membrane-bound serine protease (ClpP class)
VRVLRSSPALIAALVAILLAAYSARLFVVSAEARASGPVMLVDVKGAIGVGTAYHLGIALKEARQQDAALIVIRLDTPGGLVAATRGIIQDILASPIPVAVWVAPSGARAASAGTYIAYAAHISAMAPGTHLGAATPIQLGAPGLPSPSPKPAPGRPDEPGSGSKGRAMEQKVVNDAVAYLKALAQLRGRNAEWAEKAVREAATLTADEALKERVVDMVTADLGDLLTRIDGRTVTMSVGEQRLAVRNAVVTPVEADWMARFLSSITNPNIAFILLMIGVYGILFEFWSPGLTGPGVVGGISLIVALMALSLLPISYAGLALLALGILLMVAEAVAPGLGILGLGGIIAFSLGGIFLFEPSGADIDFRLAWPVLISVTLTSALLLAGVLGFLIRVHRRKVVSGPEEMIGLEGQVVSWSGNEGRIRIHGEMWAARATQPLTPGTKVSVRQRQGLTLIVGPIEERT